MIEKQLIPPPHFIPLELWQQLSLLDKLHIWVIVFNRYLEVKNQTIPPTYHFAGQVSLMTFLLLLVMPQHPMAIPAGIGGALAIALIPAMFGPYMRAYHNPARSRRVPVRLLSRLFARARLPLYSLILLLISLPNLAELPLFILYTALATDLFLIIILTTRNICWQSPSAELQASLLAAASCVLTIMVVVVIPTGLLWTFTRTFFASAAILVVLISCWLYALGKQILLSVE